MKKRILALSTILVALTFAFAACKKEDSKEPQETTPTVSAENDSASDNKNNTTEIETIPFGGDFTRDNGNLSFYIADGTWNVTGYHLSNGNYTSPIILMGSVSLKDGPVFLYSDTENELSFTFSTESVSVAVTKGTAYKVFEGTFARHIQDIPQQEVLSPEKGSSLELLGRIALTHYMQTDEGKADCTNNFSDLTYDNAYMTDFLFTYGNLFLSGEATFLPEVSESSPVCTISKSALNDLFLTVSAGTFNVSSFDGSAKNIVAKNDMYYIPCNGAFAGGLTVNVADEELVSDALIINGIVAKNDGTRYDITMTLNTSTDTACGTTQVRINTVNYKLAK